VAKKSKLLDQVRNVIRTKHYSYATEKTYVDWIYRFILFHDKQHPEKINEKGISDFLTFLAVEREVAASTQNQALNVIVFLYKEVLKIQLNDLSFKHSRIGKRVPVVLSRNEVKKVLSQLEGEAWLMASLLYGSGLRLTECLPLRIKDVDYELNEIIVRDGKGNNDRRTLLPSGLKDNLNLQITLEDSNAKTTLTFFI